MATEVKRTAHDIHPISEASSSKRNTKAKEQPAKAMCHHSKTGETSSPPEDKANAEHSTADQQHQGLLPV